MKPIVLRPEAQFDSVEAYRWYENQRVGLGDEFRAALQDAFTRIQEFPQAHPVLLRETRRARLRRFPYAVFYREYDDSLVVVAVFHGRRDPSRWRERT